MESGCKIKKSEMNVQLIHIPSGNSEGTKCPRCQHIKQASRRDITQKLNSLGIPVKIDYSIVTSSNPPRNASQQNRNFSQSSLQIIQQNTPSLARSLSPEPQSAQDITKKQQNIIKQLSSKIATYQLDVKDLMERKQKLEKNIQEKAIELKDLQNQLDNPQYDEANKNRKKLEKEIENMRKQQKKLIQIIEEKDKRIREMKKLNDANIKFIQSFGSLTQKIIDSQENFDQHFKTLNIQNLPKPCSEIQRHQQKDYEMMKTINRIFNLCLEEQLRLTMQNLPQSQVIQNITEFILQNYARNQRR